jgi:coproporphyrinogen III oxidase
MNRTCAQSEPARRVLVLIDALQQRFVQGLEAWGGESFAAHEWLRDGGRHGGGIRYSIGGTEALGRASVNVSQVHYEDQSDRKLGSATALSAIVHPAHPYRASVHIHISWTGRKDGTGYWRIMADLNPAIPRPEQTESFAAGLAHAAPGEFEEALKRGARYFYIPALKRHRGTVHFYLEQYDSGCADDDLQLAARVGEAAVDGYLMLLREPCPPVSQADRDAQLAYHTLYCFQVLTLDRGTTAGLLVHDENDIGIMGSLPPRVDRRLLASWMPRMPRPQDQLLAGILSVFPDDATCDIDDRRKGALAQVVRRHYQRFPQALKLQASGDAIPPARSNHEAGGA